MSGVGINLIFVFGPPLPQSPAFAQTTYAVVTDGTEVWMTAQTPGALAPGPLTPPVGS